MRNVIAILHNILSLYNVGSMFRTADGAGVSKLYLTGYTGFPPRKEIAKTALGAEESVAWERYRQIGRLITKLKKRGYLIVAVENKRKNIKIAKYYQFQTKIPIVLIFGNEVRGLSKRVLKKADVILEIPMRGQKESLNVSVAFGIIAYQALND